MHIVGAKILRRAPLAQDDKTGRFHGSYQHFCCTGLYCGTVRRPFPTAFLPCIQVFPDTNIVYYTKPSADCVHMILYEKFLPKKGNFGGTDKGFFLLDFSAIK
jgi:hypothetical protein